MVIVPDQCGSNSPKIGLFFIRTFGAISTISGGLYVCPASPSRREGMGSDNRTKGIFVITNEIKKTPIEVLMPYFGTESQKDC